MLKNKILDPCKKREGVPPRINKKKHADLLVNDNDHHAPLETPLRHNNL